MIALDCEVYPNYFLVSFKSLEGKVVSFETTTVLPENNRKRINKILTDYDTFGFNSIKYDLVILTAAIYGYSTTQLYNLSKELIEGENWYFKILENHGLPYKYNAYKNTDWNKHFDLMEVAPGVRVGLKNYGLRLHSHKLQDLPIDPDKELTEDEMLSIKLYCENDLDTTIDLYEKIKDRIDLRRSMEGNLLSKSDAQIAEVVITDKLRQQNIRPVVPNVPNSYNYIAPEFITFKTDHLKDLLKTVTSISFNLSKSGSIELPKELKDLKIKIGETTYKIGIGGLHSTEKNQVVKGDYLIIDKDVTSYYPSIILNNNLYPKHLTTAFLKVYADIVNTRIKAKKEGNKLVADSLKITINGSFGKFGSKYSKLYSPGLLLQVTLTGQLSLLMLIERLELLGFSVVSANTDGFVTKVPHDRYDEFNHKCKHWEYHTQFELEETRYKALYSRDVNNYIAVTEDDKIKSKGVYSEPSLIKNIDTWIVYKAIRLYLTKNIPLEETITSSTDIRDFLIGKRVTGGAVWRDQYLGKVVRWYYSTNGESIHYKKNGNKVGKSDGARPLMDLQDNIPIDLDYNWYINEAKKNLLIFI